MSRGTIGETVWRRSLPEQPQTRTSPELLTIVRAFFGPTLFIGGWQLISASFTAGICIAYAGFLICLAEIIWEPALLRKSYAIQVILIGVLLLFLDLFTIGVVLVSAPICVRADIVPAQFAPDVGPGGIAWKPFFTELDMSFANQTDMTYEKLDVLVRPEYYVAVIGQLSNLADVSFEDKFGMVAHVSVDDERTLLKMKFLSTDAGYKVHCGRIPPHSSLQLILAVVQMIKTSPGNGPLIVPPNANMKGFSAQATVKEKDGTKFTYWYGDEANKGIYVPNPHPTKVTVQG